MKLQYMPYAQAKVELYGNDSLLISYQTVVAGIVENWLAVNGLYSPTTRRHIMAYVKEYAPTVADFHTIKALVANNWEINIETGEIRDRT